MTDSFLTNITVAEPSEEERKQKREKYYTELNKKFCNFVGISPLASILTNTSSGDYRAYYSRSSCYKIPAAWKKQYNAHCFVPYAFKKPIYPNLINSSFNFCKLIAAQYEIMGSIEIYCNDNTPLPVKYLQEKVRAFEMMKVLDTPNIVLMHYCKALQHQYWEYDLESEVSDEEFQIVVK